MMTVAQPVWEQEEPCRLPRIDALRVRNYRVLRALDLAPLGPLSVLIGPNGSGKSTVVDVFAFLADAFSGGVAGACASRGGFEGLRTLGEDGPVVIQLDYRQPGRVGRFGYHIAIEDGRSGPVIASEWLSFTADPADGPVRLFSFERGNGWIRVSDDPAGLAGTGQLIERKRLDSGRRGGRAAGVSTGGFSPRAGCRMACVRSRLSRSSRCRRAEWALARRPHPGI